MLANPNARLNTSKIGESSVFAEAIQRLVDDGHSVAEVLYSIAMAHPTGLADATALARDFVSLSQRGYTPIGSVIDE